MHQQPTIETKRLILRPITEKDIPRVVEIAGRKDVYDMTLNIPHPYDEDLAREWLGTHKPTYENQEGAIFGICTHDDHTLVGAIGLKSTPQSHKGELGYWMCPEQRSKGYCTEALIALIEFAFDKLSYHKLSANFMEENKASGRVMEKAGMQYEGRLVDESYKDGKYRTLVVFGIINQK